MSLTDADAQRVCEHIASGRSLRSIGDQAIERAVYRELAKPDSPFGQQYARARELQAESDADAVSEIRDRVLSGDITPEQGRVALDALKWSAGKRNPKKYGDKIQVDQDLTLRLEVHDPTARTRARIIEHAAAVAQLPRETDGE